MPVLDWFFYNPPNSSKKLYLLILFLQNIFQDKGEIIFGLEPVTVSSVNLKRMRAVYSVRLKL